MPPPQVMGLFVGVPWPEIIMKHSVYIQVRKETKWSYEKVEIAACVVGRAREVCSQYVAKVMFAVGGNKLWSHREFVFLVVSGRSGMSPENVAQR